MKRSNLQLIFASLFCVCLVVSNVIAGKLWLTGLPAPFDVLTCGVILFPIVYIIGDILPEVYGLTVARHVIAIGFLTNLIAVMAFSLTLIMPAPAFWQGQDAFKVVLGFTPRLLVASFCGYLVGTNANAIALVLIKQYTGGRFLWARTIGSTIVGEGLDSIFFISIAFVGSVPGDALPGMILAQALFKIVYEVIATPVTYAVIGWVKRREAAEALVAALDVNNAKD